MSLSIALSLLAGNEDLGIENDSITIPEKAEEIIEMKVDAAVAEATVELEEVKAELAEVTETADEVVEKVEELENVVEGVEALLTGNYNAVVARNTLARGGRINSELGGRNITAVNGNEDFDDFASIRAVLVAGNEGFMDTIKKAGAAVITFVKKIYNAVKNFFVGIFNKNKALQSKAKNLKARLEKAEIKDKVDEGNWARFDIKELSKFSSSKTVDQVLKVCDSVSDMADVIRDIAAGRTKPADYSRIYSSLAGKLTEGHSKVTDKGNDISQYITVKGGIRAVANVYTGKFETLEDCIKATSVLSVAYGRDGEWTPNKGVTITETTATLGKIVDSVEAALTNTRITKLAAKFNDSERNKVIGAINAVNNNPDEEKAKEIKLTCRFVQLVVSKASSLSMKETGRIEDVCSAALSYVSACIK